MIRTFGIVVMALCAVPALAAGRVRLPDGEVLRANYPVDSLKRGEEGVVGVRLRLSKEGRLKMCAVAKSSGYASLDAATCTLLIANARMKPMRTATGGTIEAETAGQVEWTLPDDQVPDAPPPFSTKAQLAYAADPIICREQPKRGSLIVRERVCLTSADWRRQIGYAQGEVHGMQTPTGAIF